MDGCYELRQLVDVAVATGGFSAAAAFLLVILVQLIQNRHRRWKPSTGASRRPCHIFRIDAE